MSYEIYVVSQEKQPVERTYATEVVKMLKGVDRIREFCKVTSGPTENGFVDIIQYEDMKERGVAREAELDMVCEAYGEARDPENEDSVGLYLDWKRGTIFAIVSLPGNEQRMEEAYAALVGFAHTYQLELFDPKEDRRINMAAPGKLPYPKKKRTVSI